MGTNYYAIIDSCPHCKRGEKLHIGKSSGGWEFLFRAYQPPHVPVLMLYKDWIELLERPTTVITNEYDEVVPFEKIILRLAPTLPGMVSARRMSEYVKGDKLVDQSQYWQDPDGAEFCNNEFS